MKMWLYLAFHQWNESVRGRDSINPDFRWLTRLLMLTLILTFLLWGSRDGLLSRFKDILLGYVPGPNGGVPVWVVGKLDSQARAIDSTVRQQIKDTLPDARFYPYIRVEKDTVSLPSVTREEGSTQDIPRKIWRNIDESDRSAPSYQGWAVKQADPLWQKAAFGSLSSSVPLSIILNKPLFEKYFDCESYGERLSNYTNALREYGLASWKERLGCLTQDNRIWLEVKSPSTRGVGNRELLPFNILWTDKKLVAQKELAFLFPLGTWHMLVETSLVPDLDYFPEGEGEASQRIKTLKAEFDSGSEAEQARVKEALRKIKECLQMETSADAVKLDGIRIKLKKPSLKQWVENCAEKERLEISDKVDTEKPFLKLSETVISRLIEYQDDHLIISCPEKESVCNLCDLSSYWSNLPGCASTQSNNKVKIGVKPEGYREGFIYTDRESIHEVLTKISTLKRGERSSLAFHASYKNSLSRFSFMNDVMYSLSWVYGLFFPVFIGFLLYIQISLVIQSRRHYYGIFLCKGMSWRELQLSVYSQIAMSFFRALLCAIAIFFIMYVILRMAVYFINIKYAGQLEIGNLSLLPFLWLDYLLLSIVVFMLSIGVAAGLLAKMKKDCHEQPAHLLKAV